MIYCNMSVINQKQKIEATPKFLRRRDKIVVVEMGLGARGFVLVFV